MRLWFTIEPNREEIDSLLDGSREGVSKTPLKEVITQAFCMMALGQQVRLTITTLKREYGGDTDAN